MSFETCPFCGKPFKRLKSHLPHCKMSPKSKISKATNKPKELPSATFKHQINKDKTNKVNADHKQSQSKKKDEKTSAGNDNRLLQNAAVTPRSAASGVLTTEEMYMDNLKPKREKDILKLRKQAMINLNLVPHQKMIYNETFTRTSEKETVSGQKQVAQKQDFQMSTHKINCSATKPLQNASHSTDWQDNTLIPKCKKSATVSEQIHDTADPLMKEYALSSEEKEQHSSVFQTKTCVWDHVKYRLNRTTSVSVSLLFPLVSSHKLAFTDFVNSSESVLNSRNATVKVSHEPYPILQSLVQKPLLSSRFQNLSVLPYSPDMATGFREAFCILSNSKILYKNTLQKCQTSTPSFPSQGLVREQSLGDVRLNELVSWLVARMPKAPKEAVSMFNKGWRWYYRKYIDVQKGGIGGIAMLIGSYCVLSYVWRYPHIKKDRWRKYH